MVKKQSPIKSNHSLSPKNRGAWRAWLTRNHEKSPGAWINVHKKASDNPGLRLEDAVEEAICFGWIDSRLHPLDEDRYLLWFSKRKPTSIWSQNNRNRVERLMAEGLMTPAGLAAVKIAQKNGAWTSLVPIDALEVPVDLQDALDEQPEAARNFTAFPDSAKKMILRWIDSAKRPDTRRKRIRETAEQAALNQKPRY